MVKYTFKYAILFPLLALTACATVPTGPSVTVLPAPGKPFDLFVKEDAACRHWAERQIGLSPQETIEQNTANGAIAGTAIGVGIGALLGAASGNTGAGALMGGASGLLIGTASGADSGRVYGWEAQHRYDTAYLQCMYASGNQLAGSGRVTRRIYRTYTAPPPPSTYESIPPPPPGATPQTPPELLENEEEMP